MSFDNIWARLRVATVIVLASAVYATPALAFINFVFHSGPSASALPGCGGLFTETSAPGPTDVYPLRVSVEYESSADSSTVYYTTDGTPPDGIRGVPTGTTAVVPATIECVFDEGGPDVEVWSAVIPAQPEGTLVRYIVSAWHTDTGISPNEVFGNSGECCTGTHTVAADADVFEYTVSAAPSVCGDGLLQVGEGCDDGGTVPGDCCSATCQVESAGTVCRVAAFACDAEETCDGLESTCPADAVEPDGLTCDDADPTTVADVCEAGVCVGVPAAPVPALGRLGLPLTVALLLGVGAARLVGQRRRDARA